MNNDTFDKKNWAIFKEEFKTNYKQHPSTLSALFVIGLEQLQNLNINTLSKEEKQDVIHVGLCTLLEQEGIYTREEIDQDGWPHFKPTNKAEIINIEKQENYIRKLILTYFNYD